MRALTLDRHLPAISPEPADSSRTGRREYRLEAVFHDSREVLSFAMPGLYIADSTRFALSLSADGMMDASLRSPRLAFGRNYVRGVEMVFGSTEPSMELKLSGSEMLAAFADHAKSLGIVPEAGRVANVLPLGDRFMLNFDGNILRWIHIWPPPTASGSSMNPTSSMTARTSGSTDSGSARDDS